MGLLDKMVFWKKDPKQVEPPTVGAKEIPAPVSSDITPEAPLLKSVPPVAPAADVPPWEREGSAFQPLGRESLHPTKTEPADVPPWEREGSAFQPLETLGASAAAVPTGVAQTFEPVELGIDWQGAVSPQNTNIPIASEFVDMDRETVLRAPPKQPIGWNDVLNARQVRTGKNDRVTLAEINQRLGFGRTAEMRGDELTEEQSLELYDQWAKQAGWRDNDLHLKAYNTPLRRAAGRGVTPEERTQMLRIIRRRDMETKWEQQLRDEKMSQPKTLLGHAANTVLNVRDMAGYMANLGLFGWASIPNEAATRMAELKGGAGFVKGDKYILTKEQRGDVAAMVQGSLDGVVAYSVERFAGKAVGGAAKAVGLDKLATALGKTKTGKFAAELTEQISKRIPKNEAISNASKAAGFNSLFEEIVIEEWSQALYDGIDEARALDADGNRQGILQAEKEALKNIAAASPEMAVTFAIFGLGRAGAAKLANSAQAAGEMKARREWLKSRNVSPERQNQILATKDPKELGRALFKVEKEFIQKQIDSDAPQIASSLGLNEEDVRIALTTADPEERARNLAELIESAKGDTPKAVDALGNPVEPKKDLPTFEIDTPQPKATPPVQTLGEGAPAVRVRATAKDGTVLGEVLADAKSEAKAIKQLRKAHPGAYLIQAEELAAEDRGRKTEDGRRKTGDGGDWRDAARVVENEVNTLPVNDALAALDRAEAILQADTEMESRDKRAVLEKLKAKRLGLEHDHAHQKAAALKGRKFFNVNGWLADDFGDSGWGHVVAGDVLVKVVVDGDGQLNPAYNVDEQGIFVNKGPGQAARVRLQNKGGMAPLMFGDSALEERGIKVRRGAGEAVINQNLPLSALTTEAKLRAVDVIFNEMDVQGRLITPEVIQKIAENLGLSVSEVEARVFPNAPVADVNSKADATPAPKPKAESQKPSSDNIYTRMPIERVRADAANGVSLAKEALEKLETGNLKPDPIGSKEVRNEDEPEYIELPQEDRSEGIGVSDAPAPVAKKKRKRTAAQLKNDAELKRKMQPVDTALAEFRKLHPYIKAPKKTDSVYTELMGLSAKEPGAVSRRFFRQNPALSSYDQILDEAHAQIPHIITEDDLGEPSALAKIYGFRLETVGEMEVREAQEWDDRAAAEASAQFEAQFMLYIEDEMLPPSGIREEHPLEWSRALERAGVDESTLYDREAPITDEEIQAAAELQPLENKPQTTERTEAQRFQDSENNSPRTEAKEREKLALEYLDLNAELPDGVSEMQRKGLVLAAQYQKAVDRMDEIEKQLGPAAGEILMDVHPIWRKQKQTTQSGRRKTEDRGQRPEDGTFKPKASSLTPSMSWKQLAGMKRGELRKLADQTGVAKDGKNIELQRRIAEKIGGQVENDMLAERLAEAGKQTDTNPTDGQKQAENYKVGRIRYRGLAISIENPKGSIRRGQDADGKEWAQKMANTYGRILGTRNADGDNTDVFFNDASPVSDTVYIINQTDAQGRFDEEKVMFGFESEAKARAAYLANYEKGWDRIGSVEEMSFDAFTELISNVDDYARHLNAKKPTKVSSEENSKLETRNSKRGSNGSSTAQDLGIGSGTRQAGQAARAGAIELGGAGAGRNNRPDVGADDGSGDSPAGDPLLPSGADALRGERGDNTGGAQVAEPGTAAGTAGGADPQRGGLSGAAGVQSGDRGSGTLVRITPESEPDGAGGADSQPVEQSAAQALKQRIAQQKKAEAIPAKAGDADNIRETLPVLFTEQHDDVIHAENRIMVEDKHGMLFTNGTGTGKTFTGLGIIKRFQKMGKGEILILTPKQEKNKDWVKEGAKLGIEAQVLESTTDGGKGVTITTYNNFYQNRALAQRDFDLVVYDESHKLDASQQQGSTVFSLQHKALTKHPGYLWHLAELRSPKWQAYQQRLDKLAEQVEQKHFGQEVPNADPLLEQAYNLVFPDLGKIFDGPKKDRLQAIRAKVRTALDTQRESELKEMADAARAEMREIETQLKAAPRGKAVFLSASPFAYHVSLDYAEGYLFDYEPSENVGGYNVATGLDKLLQDNFGYQMKNGKLNRPDAEVNVDLMERMFFEKLKEEGAVRGRQLDVPVDYSRHFVDISVSKQGALLNNAFATLYSGNNEFDQLRSHVQGLYTFHYLNYMMESMKAAEAVKRTRKHLDLGRKVVLFHGYKKATKDFENNRYPFRFEKMDETQGYWKEREAAKKFNAELKRFYAAVPGIETVRWNFPDPLELFQREFGEEAVFVNGNVPGGKRSKNIDAFNRKDGPKVIVMQIDAGKEGTSLHDTEGDMPRAVINIGLPYKPMDLIQSEGRTYRLGSQSNAVYEYLKLGLNFEQVAFNQKISTRSRTAENLALGNLARDMEQVLKDGYLNSTAEEPSLEQGTGGKETDKRVQAGEMGGFEHAKTFYFAKQKRNSRTKSREGADYFATPEPVGFKMAEWAGARPGERMLEPSAGDGAIGRWFREDTQNTFVEPSYELMTKLQTNVSGSHNRFETDNFEELYIGNKYNAIVMNPPFGAGGKTAIEHLAKAFNHLKDGGRVVALIPEGPSADKRFDKWVESPAAEHAYVAGNIHLPNITFERAGTQVKTRIVIIDKQSNPADAQQTRELSLESAEKISELFDRIEDIGFDPPSVPTPVVEKAEDGRRRTEDGRRRTEELARGLTSSRDFVLPDRAVADELKVGDVITITERHPVLPYLEAGQSFNIDSFQGNTVRLVNTATGAGTIEKLSYLKRFGKFTKEGEQRFSVSETPERAKYRAAEPVKLTGAEVGVPPMEYRRAAKWAAENGQTGTFKNAETGWDVIVTKNRIVRALHRGAARDKVRMLAGIRSMIERAVYLESADDYKPKAISHFFAVPVQVAGKEYAVGFVIHEDAQTHKRYYTHELVEEKDLKGAVPKYGQNAEAPRGHVRSVLQKHLGVNPSETSRFSVAPDALGFYSPLERAVEGFKQETFTVEQLAGMVRNAPGVKAEELEDIGWEEFLATKNTKITKAEALEFIRNGGPQIQEVEKGANQVVDEQYVNSRIMTEVKRDYDLSVLGDRNLTDALFDFEDGKITDEELSEISGVDVAEIRQRLYESTPTRSDDKFAQYQLPGGENYREVLLTLPNASNAGEIKEENGSFVVYDPSGNPVAFHSDRQRAEKQLRQFGTDEYKSSHWDEPNVLAHVRLNDRTGPNGEKILFVEEIQSDWHQEGRKKGYIQKSEIGNQKSEIGNVPNAPFKKSWSMLAFKRVLRMAAEQGYDSVAWTPGQVHTDRWGTERIAWVKQADGSFLVHAKSQHGGVAGGVDLEAEATARDLIKESSRSVTSEQELRNAITPSLTEGQDPDALAKKLWKRMQDEESGVSYPRKEGFEGFYDKILPKEVQKYVGKLGGNVGTVGVGGGSRGLLSVEQNIAGDYFVARDGLGASNPFETAEEANAELLEMRAVEENGTEVWNLPITDQMRAQVMAGQPRFAMAGVNAATAGKTDVAEQMERVGADRTTIWKETGWWRGPDGKWRFEVDDSKLVFKKTGSTADQLSEIIDHPELFAAYPRMARLDTILTIGPDMRQSGVYQPYEDRGPDIYPLYEQITVNAQTQDQARESLIHEIQHAIQNRESFARGGNLDTNLALAQQFAAQESAEVNREYESAYADMVKNPTDRNKQRFESAKAQLAELYKKSPRDYKLKAYKLIPGEIEARTVEARLNMEPGVRSLTPPWQTMETMLRSEGLLTDDQKPEDVFGGQSGLRKAAATDKEMSYGTETGDDTGRDPRGLRRDGRAGLGERAEGAAGQRPTYAPNLDGYAERLRHPAYESAMGAEARRRVDSERSRRNALADRSKQALHPRVRDDLNTFEPDYARIESDGELKKAVTGQTIVPIRTKALNGFLSADGKTIFVSTSQLDPEMDYEQTRDHETTHVLEKEDSPSGQAVRELIAAVDTSTPEFSRYRAKLSDLTSPAYAEAFAASEIVADFTAGVKTRYGIELSGAFGANLKAATNTAGMLRIALRQAVGGRKGFVQQGAGGRGQGSGLTGGRFSAISGGMDRTDATGRKTQLSAEEIAVRDAEISKITADRLGVDPTIYSGLLRSAQGVKRPAKLYRGIDGNTGLRSASEGYGLYITGDLAEARKYGTVTEIDLSQMPQNPAHFRDYGEFKNFLILAADKLGVRRISDVVKDPADLLIAAGYDGAMFGSGKTASFVNYQLSERFNLSPGTEAGEGQARYSVATPEDTPAKLATVETLVKAFEERKGQYTKPSAHIMQKRLRALESDVNAETLAEFAKRSLPENFRWRLKGTLTRLANDPKVGMAEFYRAALNKTRALVEETGILASDPQAKIENGNINSPQLDAMTAAFKDLIARNEDDPKPVTESLKAEFEGEAVTDPVLKPFVESLNRSIQKTRSRATIRLVEQGKKTKMGGFFDVERAFEKLQEQTGIPFWNLYRRIFFIERDVDFFTKQDVEGVFQGLENNDGKPAKVEDIIYDPQGEQRIIMYLDTGIVAPDITDFELDVAERVKALYKEWEPFVKRAAHLAWMRTGTMPGKGTPALMKEGAEIRARYGEDSPEYDAWIEKQDFGVRKFYSPKQHEAAMKVMMEEKRNFGRGFTKQRKGPAESKSLVGGLYSYIRNARRVRDLEPHLKQLEALFDENHTLVDSNIVDRFFNNLYGNRIKIDTWQKLVLGGTGRFFRVRIPQAVLRWSLRNKFQPTTNVVPRVFSPADPLFWKHLRRIWSPFSGARVGTAQKYIQQKIDANDKLATYFHRYVSSLDAARTEKFLLEMTKYEEIAKLGQGFMRIYDTIGKGYTWSDMDNRAQTFIYGFEAGTDALARYRAKPTCANWNRFLDITGMIHAPKTEQVELANFVSQGRDEDAVYLAAHRLADATQFRYVRSERGLGWQEPGKGMHTGMPIATYWKGTMQMLGDDLSALNDFMKSPDRRSARRARKALANLAVWYLISLIINRIYEELYDVDSGAYGLNTLFYVPGGPVMTHLIEVADAFRSAWGDEKGADYKAALAIHSAADFYVPLYHLINRAATPSVETEDGTRLTQAYFKLPMEARRIVKEKLADITGGETPRDTRRWVELKAGEQMQRILLDGAQPTGKDKLQDLYGKWMTEKDFSAKEEAGKRLLEAFRKYPLSTEKSFTDEGNPRSRTFRYSKDLKQAVPGIEDDYEAQESATRRKAESLREKYGY